MFYHYMLESGFTNMYLVGVARYHLLFIRHISIIVIIIYCFSSLFVMDHCLLCIIDNHQCNVNNVIQ